ncbi:uncharacterized protein F5Z01DRAFT_645860 [Emericellopsis atlantica]|uniref:BZIP domain-containing protein n=1 Tax=Emericellopsis atlantica TaxID=2614577 RepID=A0A9P7ZSB0_9HYPO|nr:uncharacterized protein F5Z01DRAFT_645860 [Emericellopsis atlantica]KAG9257408.1 hypothetical protein F5Z01DRAFT_645860 [Emericellopsis atlantica]
MLLVDILSLFGYEENILSYSHFDTILLVIPAAPINSMHNKRESRRVANLTPAQIQRKREIDRSNQRQHRAKNKAYTARLEDRISQLKYEKALLRARLRKYEVVSDDEGDEEVIRDDDMQTVLSTSEQSRRASRSASESRPSHPDTGSPSRLGHAHLTPSSCSVSAANLQARSPRILPRNLGCGNLDSFGISVKEGPPVRDGQTDASLPRQHRPVWQRLPGHIEPTNKLDETIIKKTRAWRSCFRHIAAKVDKPDKGHLPSIYSLLNEHADDVDSRSRRVSVAEAVETSATLLAPLVKRIIIMYKLAYYIRWLACQTQQSYNQMPDYLKPTELQRTIPHPAWIDIISYPDARDALIQMRDWSVFEKFEELVGATTFVDWPYSTVDAVQESAGELRMNPNFEAYIRDLKNWSCGCEVVKRFPFMAAHVAE